jgi:hypothetical protein
MNVVARLFWRMATCGDMIGKDALDEGEEIAQLSLHLEPRQN